MFSPIQELNSYVILRRTQVFEGLPTYLSEGLPTYFSHLFLGFDWLLTGFYSWQIKLFFSPSTPTNSTAVINPFLLTDTYNALFLRIK